MAAVAEIIDAVASALNAALLALRLEHRVWRPVVVGVLAVACFGAKEIGILLPVTLVLWLATVERDRWRQLVPAAAVGCVAVLAMLVLNRAMVAGSPSLGMQRGVAPVADLMSSSHSGRPQWNAAAKPPAWVADKSASTPSMPRGS